MNLIKLFQWISFIMITQSNAMIERDRDDIKIHRQMIKKIQLIDNKKSHIFLPWI